VVQIAVFFVVGRALPHFADAIKAGRVAAATLLAALSVAVGILNAACMTLPPTALECGCTGATPEAQD
jgi:putative membrane protein